MVSCVEKSHNVQKEKQMPSSTCVGCRLGVSSVFNWVERTPHVLQDILDEYGRFRQWYYSAQEHLRADDWGIDHMQRRLRRTCRIIRWVGLLELYAWHRMETRHDPSLPHLESNLRWLRAQLACALHKLDRADFGMGNLQWLSFLRNPILAEIARPSDLQRWGAIKSHYTYLWEMNCHVEWHGWRVDDHLRVVGDDFMFPGHGPYQVRFLSVLAWCEWLMSFEPQVMKWKKHQMMEDFHKYKQAYHTYVTEKNRRIKVLLQDLLPNDVVVHVLLPYVGCSL